MEHHAPVSETRIVLAFFVTAVVALVPGVVACRALLHETAPGKTALLEHPETWAWGGGAVLGALLLLVTVLAARREIAREPVRA